ncbi:hypothetical protein SDJN03_26423, partial [Cucurbita argyrosperma subsp. sororia]
MLFTYPNSLFLRKRVSGLIPVSGAIRFSPRQEREYHVPHNNTAFWNFPIEHLWRQKSLSSGESHAVTRILHLR